MTWSSRIKPVKFPLNKFRGNGVTIFGAIGEHLPKAVFSLADTTNTEHTLAFLQKLRDVVGDNPMHQRGRKSGKTRMVLVLDNHRAHIGEEVAQMAHQLNMELLFLPPYSP